MSVLPTTVQDTPQAVNVIPQEEMHQQAVSSLEQALRNVPGITIAIGEGGTLAGDQFKIRGFDAKDDIYMDGLRDFGVYTRDSFNYEEVQVLKGPSGALFGRGNTGGVINIVSKTPFLEDHMSAKAYAGNGSYFRGYADFNKVIGDTTAIRLNVMGNSTGVVDRDVVKSKRWGIAPSIGFGLGTDTTFTIDYLHQYNDNIPDYGLPVSVNPVTRIAIPVSENGIPRSNFVGYNTDKDRGTADIVTARVNHQATPWLTITNDTRVGIYSRYFQYTTVDRCDELPATNGCALAIASGNLANAYGGIGGSGPYSQSAWGAQNILTARADHDIGGFKNQFIAGFDASYQSNARTFFAYTLPPAAATPSDPGFYYILGNHSATRANIGVSLLDPIHTPPAGYTVFLPMLGSTVPQLAGTTAATTTNLYVSGNATDYALFGVERFWLNDEWSVIGSLRWDDYQSSYNTTTIANDTTLLDANSSFFSPRASLVWEPTQDQTYYFSYGRSSTPQGTSIVGNGTGIALTTADLKPETGETFELGAKVGFFDGAVSVTGSLFNVKKNNATQVDPITEDVLAQSGEKQRARGFELGVTGHVTPDWTITASYTYLDTTVLESYSNCIASPASNPPTGIICPSGVLPGTPVVNPLAIGSQIIFTPRNAATLWTSYDFSNRLLPGLSAGGGITYQDKLFNAYTAASQSITNPGTIVPYRIVEIPETVQLDFFAAYKIQNLEFGINLINATDRLNYSQSFGNRGTPAAGRTVLFSVGVDM